MEHAHSASNGTAGHVYEYCECGATRRRLPDGSYEDWHVCDVCRVQATPAGQVEPAR